MAHRLLEAHWREDADLSDAPTLGAIAEELGHDREAMLAEAGSAAIQERLEANTALAVERKVFGSPTYIVDNDPFYGQDRLELVERAIRQPFAPSTWVNPRVS
jgi:2-hydroxychromene-2-carboxylate isomerase